VGSRRSGKGHGGVLARKSNRENGVVDLKLVSWVELWQ